MFNQRMEVQIKQIKKPTVALLLSVYATVNDLKLLIEEEQGIAFGEQKLIFEGSVLLFDDFELSLYEIKDKSVVHLLERSKLPAPIESPVFVGLQHSAHMWCSRDIPLTIDWNDSDEDVFVSIIWNDGDEEVTSISNWDDIDEE